MDDPILPDHQPVPIVEPAPDREDELGELLDRAASYLPQAERWLRSVRAGKARVSHLPPPEEAEPLFRAIQHCEARMRAAHATLREVEAVPVERVRQETRIRRAFEAMQGWRDSLYNLALAYGHNEQERTYTLDDS